MSALSSAATLAPKVPGDAGGFVSLLNDILNNIVPARQTSPVETPDAQLIGLSLLSSDAVQNHQHNLFGVPRLTQNANQSSWPVSKKTPSLAGRTGSHAKTEASFSRVQPARQQTIAFSGLPLAWNASSSHQAEVNVPLRRDSQDQEGPDQEPVNLVGVRPLGGEVNAAGLPHNSGGTAGGIVPTEGSRLRGTTAFELRLTANPLGTAAGKEPEPQADQQLQTENPVRSPEPGRAVSLPANSAPKLAPGSPFDPVTALTPNGKAPVNPLPGDSSQVRGNMGVPRSQSSGSEATTEAGRSSAVTFGTIASVSEEETPPFPEAANAPASPRDEELVTRADGKLVLQATAPAENAADRCGETATDPASASAASGAVEAGYSLDPTPATPKGYRRPPRKPRTMICHDRGLAYFPGAGGNRPPLSAERRAQRATNQTQRAAAARHFPRRLAQASVARSRRALIAPRLLRSRLRTPKQPRLVRLIPRMTRAWRIGPPGRKS